VPFCALVLSSSVSGHDHVGDVQDVEQVTVIICGDIDIHGFSFLS
jgi:hypothetical protein